MQKSIQKKWFYASIASAVLMLGACSNNEPTPTEPEPADPDTIATVDDTQPMVEQQPLVEEQPAPDVASTSGVTTTGEVTNINDMDNTDQDMGSTRGELPSLNDGATATDNGEVDINTDNGEVDTDTDN